MSDGEQSRLLDKPDSFGWVSILVHWTTSIAVIVLWFIGKSITEQTSLEAVTARRELHVAIALWVWLLLLFRIYWRIKMRHPRARGQSLFIHRVARTTHYTMLVVVGLMMASGPVVAFVDSAPVKAAALWVHTTSANVLLILVLVHIGGTLKHLIFHEDDTIVRMLWPRKKAP